MIELIRGSIFDSKCDLIVVPCNNLGGMSKSFQNEIIANELPYPNKKIEAGDIYFIDNISSFSNASVIGYAASVEVCNLASSEEIISRIGNKIKDYCQEHSLRKINIPLLGTGAGGLPAKISYEIMENIFTSISNVSVYVYVISEDMYIELADKRKRVIGNQIKNPRVFISYTGADAENRTWVKNLASRLRESGVDARLDMFHLKPGQDLPQWMTNELLMADKVLLICDKYYAEKADSRKGGVGWETMIIQGDMLSRQEQNKYVAILRDKNIDQSLPVYVKSKYALNWADESQMEKEFNELLLYLFDCDIEPPLGEIPLFIKEKMGR